MAIRRVRDENLDQAVDGWSGENVFLFRWNEERGGDWNVTVGAMEFLRGGVEGQVRRAIAAALGAVPGVDEIREEDREVWSVKGSPSGEEMAAAVDQALEPYADAIEAAGGGAPKLSPQLETELAAARTIPPGKARRDALRAFAEHQRADAGTSPPPGVIAGLQPRKQIVGAVRSAMRLTLVSLKVLSDTSVQAEFYDRDTQTPVEATLHLEFGVSPARPTTRAEPDVFTEYGASPRDVRTVHFAVVGFLQAAVRGRELSQT